MARQALVPEELRQGPFTLAEARRAGLTRHQLESSAWRRLEWGSYAWAGLRDVQMLRLLAVHRRLPPGACFCGRTAAWLHGLEVEPCDPIEITLPLLGGVSARGGVRVRRVLLRPEEIVTRSGLPTTSVVRTLADLALNEPVREAVVVIDMALQKGLTDLATLAAWAAEQSPRKGTARLRRAIALAEPATESPMETRLRLLLVTAGLPRPLAQVSLCDDGGRFVGRPDLYYPEARLGIEYDGAGHRATLGSDLRRQNQLVSAGYRLLRFTAADVNQRPDEVTAIVAAELGRARAA